MAKPPFKKDFTFVGWVEDVVKSPVSIANETYAVLKNKYDQTYVLWVVRANATEGDVKDSDVVTAYTQGAEALSDLTGINVQLRVKDLLKDPAKTVKILGKKTFEDIANIDDLSSYRRAEVMGRLVKGYGTDGLNGNDPKVVAQYQDIGRDLDKPSNYYLQGVRRVGVMRQFGEDFIDRSTGRPKSKMQLLVDVTNGADPNYKGDWEDRRIVEEQDSRDKNYKTYFTLAGSVVNLSQNVESAQSRLRGRVEANQAYSRVLLQETGIDLEKVLNTRRYKMGDELLKGQTVVDPITGNRINIDRHLVGTNYDQMGSFHRTLINRAGGDIRTLVADASMMEEALGLTPGEFGRFTPGVQDMYRNALQIEELALRNSVIGSSDTFEKIVPKWQQMGLVPEMDGTNYNSHLTGYMLRGDLEHLRNKYTTGQYVLSEGIQPEIRARISEAIDRALPGQANAALRVQKLDNTIARLESAQTSIQSSNNLYAIATLRDLFEKVRDGEFINAALVSTRLMGLIPNAPKEIRGTGEWLAVLEPGNLENVINKKVLKPLAPSIQRNLGISEKDLFQFANPLALGKFATGKLYETLGLKNTTDANGQLTGLQKFVNEKTPLKGIFNSESIVEWTAKDPVTGMDLGHTTFWKVGAADAQGVFGDTGVFTLFDDLYTDYRELCEHPLLARHINPQELFANMDDLDALMNQMHFIANNPNAALGQADLALKEVMHRAGLLFESNGQIKFNEFYSEYTNKFLAHGKNMLEDLGRKGGFFGKEGLPALNRYDFLKRLKLNGKAKELSKLYVTWLEKYTRYANGLNNFIQKNIIYGDLLFTLPIIGKLIEPIYRPIQNLLKSAGFSEEAQLYTVISKLSWIQKIDTGIGSLKTRLFAGAGGRGAIGRIAGQIFTKALLPILKIFGLGAGVAASAATAGLSLLLSQLASTGFKMTLRLLRLDFEGAGKILINDTIGLLKTIAKPFKWLFFCAFGCCLSPIFFLMIFTATVVPGTFAPLEKLGSPIPPQAPDNASSLFIVTKTGLKTDETWDAILFPQHTAIEYMIQVTNTSDAPITIISFEDVHTMNKGGCSNIQSYGLGDPEFKGNLDSNFRPDMFVNKTIDPGQNITMKYKLLNIATKQFGWETLEITYLNTVQVVIQEDPTKVNSRTVSIDLDKGSCSECPSGLPFTSAFPGISACPGPGSASAWHVGNSLQSIDYPLTVGNEVIATHSGTVGVKLEASSGGYGNLITIKASEGYYTYYAHLSVVSVSPGDVVVKGQVIGKTGETGNGGPHLHYEFRGSCLGKALIMDEPYIPEQYSCDKQPDGTYKP